LGSYGVHNRQAGEIQLKHPVDLDFRPGPNWTGTKPDIYYIILDAYGRADILEDIYEIDNTPFIESLEKRGFNIAKNSHTNYWKTGLSLTSSLNFHYLDELIEINPDLTTAQPLNTLFQDNQIQRFLRSLGYQSVAFETGYNFSENRTVDIYYRTGNPFSPFETMLLVNSMALFYFDQAAPVFHRLEIYKAFHDLKESTKIPGPKLVFAHLVIPHPPFVFDENGGPVSPMGSAEGTAYQGGREHYLQHYGPQLLYANKLVLEAVDEILANSKIPPIIIIQGDHGPGAYLDWSSVENTCLHERMGILNAYYLPGAEPVDIPDDITPVNSFRIVFNQYFDTHLAMEANRHYADNWERIYQFYDVTDRLDACPNLK